MRRDSAEHGQATPSSSGQNDSPAFAGPREAFSQRRARDHAKWEGMVSAGLPYVRQAQPETFQRRVRRGVPDEFRAEVWKCALEYHSVYEPGVYCEELWAL